MTKSFILTNFSNKTVLDDWKVVNDGVMGGKSHGHFSTDTANAIFEGNVSLENNGGFSLVRHQMKTLDVSKFTTFVIKLKGDESRYQFRIKHKTEDDYAYVFYFKTSGNWETISISIAEMYPTFRGRKLNMPNFGNDTIEEIAFLIGNKTEQQFKLLIDGIYLK